MVRNVGNRRHDVGTLNVERHLGVNEGGRYDT